jgi:hypothetical protein
MQFYYIPNVNWGLLISSSNLEIIGNPFLGQDCMEFLYAFENAT